MNVLYNAQSISLDLFHNLMKDMNQRHGVKTSGIYISDSRYYSDYVKKNQDLENYPTLKEWDVLKKGLSREPELTKLQELEKKYGDPNFWNVLIADRRLIFGRKLVFEQDYKSKYSHSQLLSILQTGFEEIEQLFDRLKPDCVIGFICVTLGEYISYLIAKDRGIPFINIRPTKIKSYMLGDENIYEPCLMIKPIYEDFLKNGVPKKYEREVDDYLSQARVEHAKHEGFIAPPKKKLKIVTKLVKGVKSIASKKIGYKLNNVFQDYKHYIIQGYKYDNHFNGLIYPKYFMFIKKPIRLIRRHHFMKNKYVGMKDLKQIRYCFFPLHKEPEVSLLVYSRHYLNQIEVIRNLAYSLPVGMKLVIKEHPAGMGYRGLGYYKKLLDIPNVCIAEPSLTGRDVSQNAKLIAVISGGVAWEALFLKKPVIHFGNISFSHLPDTMIKKVEKFENLSDDIVEIMNNYCEDESALRAFLAAIMDFCVPVDFYSVLLGRKGGHGSIADEDKSEFNRQIPILSDYLANHPCFSMSKECRGKEIATSATSPF